MGMGKEIITFGNVWNFIDYKDDDDYKVKLLHIMLLKRMLI